MGAQNIDIEHAPHPLDAHIDQPRARRDDPGVDDHPVERAERARRAFEHLEHVSFESDIAMQRDTPAAGALNFANDALRALFVADVIDADRPAAPAGQQGRGAADAARGASDEDGFPGHETSVSEQMTTRRSPRGGSFRLSLSFWSAKTETG
jgi:hypothetical protein